MHIIVYGLGEATKTSCTVDWQSNPVKECIKPCKSWGEIKQTQRVQDLNLELNHYQAL